MFFELLPGNIFQIEADGQNVPQKRTDLALSLIHI